MILVDTARWIDHLQRRDATLAGWLDRGVVLGHPFVQGELACGQLRRRTEILALFDRLPPAVVVDHAEVLQLVEARRLAGTGLGWIDVHLLASAVWSGAGLATPDRMLAQAAAALGVPTHP